MEEEKKEKKQTEKQIEKKPKAVKVTTTKKTSTKKEDSVKPSTKKIASSGAKRAAPKKTGSQKADDKKTQTKKVEVKTKKEEKKETPKEIKAIDSEKRSPAKHGKYAKAKIEEKPEKKAKDKTEGKRSIESWAKEQRAILEKKLAGANEAKKKMNIQTLKNILIGVCVCIYHVLLCLGYKNIEKEVLTIDLWVFSGALLIAAISLFEQSYKKDSAKLCIHGIEALYLAILTLFTPYMFFYLDSFFRQLFPSLFFIAIVVYYFIKAIIIEYRMTKKYQDSLSDVKEIVKKGV